MPVYRLKSHNGTGLYLNVQTSTTISGRTNVTIYNNTARNDQEWLIDSLSSNQRVRTMNNTDYMLNAARSTWNCDVYLDNSDTKINFQALGNSVYRLQLASEPTRYLTATGTSLGSNVNWRLLSTSSSAQKWLLEYVSVDPDPPEDNEHILEMPVGPRCNWNQKNYAVTQYFGASACTLVAGLDAANYYATDGIGYTPADMVNYWVSGSGFTWQIPGPGTIGAEITGKTQAQFLAIIKSEIDAGHPVLVNIGPSSSNNHTLFAYGYINSAATTSDIYVYDPANMDTGNIAGREDTLYGAMDYNSDRFTIRSLRPTSG